MILVWYRWKNHYLVEMIRATGDMGTSMIRDLAVAIISDGKVPSDWEQSFIVCLYKGKCIGKGKLQWSQADRTVMKILDRIVDGLIRQLVSVYDSQFGYIPGRGTTDTIFVVRQLQEKYLATNKRLYMAFVDLEKAFDRVPQKVIWWVLRKLGVEDWIVNWCRGCMQMRGAVSMLVRGTVKRWSEGWCSPRISTQPTALHHCTWILIMRVPLWGPLGRPLCWWPCYHRWIAWGMCQEVLDMERSNGEERTERKCRKDKDYDLRYGTGPPAEFRRVSMRSLSHWSGQQQHLLQWLQALGAQEMQWAQAFEKRPWQMYKVPGNCTPLGWQTTEGSPGRTWQAWGGSFLLLPRRHALSSRWLWTFNHNTFENRLEEVQGSATSSLFTPPLFQNTWPCVQLLCAERNAPCQRDLAIEKAKPPASPAKWRCNDQTDLQCQTARHCHHQVQWATCAAWHQWSGLHSEREKTLMVWKSQTSSTSSEMTVQWSDRSAMSDRKTLSPPGPMSYLCSLAPVIWTAFWKREDSDGMDMWKAPMVQSGQPLTYRLMESVGLGGPRWHGNSWQRGIAESGSSQPSTLMIDIPGDLVWDLSCVQQASYLEGGPLVWMLPLYLLVNQKSDYDDMMIVNRGQSFLSFLLKNHGKCPKKF